MRLISNEELLFVAGGVAMTEDGGGNSIIPNLWDIIVTWIGGLGSGSSSSVEETVFQTVTISAPKWTEADEVKMQIEQGLSGVPGSANCTFVFQINPNSTTVSASATVAVAPSATTGGSQTWQTATKTWNCVKK